MRINNDTECEVDSGTDCANHVYFIRQQFAQTCEIQLTSAATDCYHNATGDFVLTNPLKRDDTPLECLITLRQRSPRLRLKALFGVTK